MGSGEVSKNFSSHQEVFVAQLAERESHNLEVEGSSPSEGTPFATFYRFPKKEGVGREFLGDAFRNKNCSVP